LFSHIQRLDESSKGNWLREENLYRLYGHSGAVLRRSLHCSEELFKSLAEHMLKDGWLDEHSVIGVAVHDHAYLAISA
jgi:hypothetical protein